MKNYRRNSMLCVLTFPLAAVTLADQHTDSCSSVTLLPKSKGCTGHNHSHGRERTAAYTITSHSSLGARSKGTIAGVGSGGFGQGWVDVKVEGGRTITQTEKIHVVSRGMAQGHFAAVKKEQNESPPASEHRSLIRYLLEL